MINNRKGSTGNQLCHETFDSYPRIQHASLIKSLLMDMLNPTESKRASAKSIQEKYREWLSGNFWYFSQSTTIIRMKEENCI